MQFKMEEIKTPKGNKKTPKKVNVKKTPLKKDESTKTPKKVNAKASPMNKVESAKSPKSPANVPNLGKNTPKQNSNGTPKQGKLQKKTPQKGDKSPQSVSNTPKTPDSNLKKRKRRQNRSNDNKKQKVDDTSRKQKKVIAALNKDVESTISAGRTVRVRVSFPFRTLVKHEDLLEIFKDCETASFERPVMMTFNPNVASKKIQELKKIKIGEKSLYINTETSQPSLFKGTIRLMNPEDVEKAKKFYNPKSIEKLFNRFGKASNTYVLTFETEKEAISASEKMFKLGNNVLSLQAYYESNLKEKVDSTKPVQKQNESQPKQAKNAQKQKLEQKNSKADEESDEEEEDDEDSDFDGDSTMEGIKIEDADDDDEDDDDEDEDDDDDDDDDEEEEE